jgi:prepilin-type N-terminal cleavage/methylation domain-containing protein
MKRRGFTLIEILLVVVIIGIMLAVIVPRAWRANIDTKYGLVRQNCSELGNYGMQWAETELLSQDEEGSTAVLADYLAHLCGDPGIANDMRAAWVAAAADSGGDDPAAWNNWQGVGLITGRLVDDVEVGPKGTAKSFVPVDKIPRNPFNGQSVFDLQNWPAPAGVGTAVPGAIANGYYEESDNWYYFAFVFQGTENVDGEAADDADYHADMAVDSLDGLRNGIFFARTKKGGAGD